MCLSRLAILASVLLLASSARAVVPPQLDPMGDLPGNFFGSIAEDMSNDGRVLVGSSSSSESYSYYHNAARWTPETGIVSLGQPPQGSYSSYAQGASADGSVVVGFFSPDPQNSSHVEIFRWTAETGMVSLGDLPGGIVNSGGHAVSADGSVIVGSGYTTGTVRAFAWTQASGFVLLPPASGTGWSGANDVSAAGGVVVGWGDDEATRWDQGAATALGLLPDANSSTAEGVSGDGHVVVGHSGIGGQWLEAVRSLDGGPLEGLGHLPEGFYGYAIAATHDGSVIVGSEAVGDRNVKYWDYRAFVWDAERGPRDLNTLLTEVYGMDLGGWTLRSATSVSDDALTIAGRMQNAARENQGFRLVLPPECDDGVDNDGDGAADFPADPGCWTRGDAREDLGRRIRCGLGGPELLLPLAIVLAWRRRRGGRAQPPPRGTA